MDVGVDLNCLCLPADVPTPPYPTCLPPSPLHPPAILSAPSTCLYASLPPPPPTPCVLG